MDHTSSLSSNRYTTAFGPASKVYATWGTNTCTNAQGFVRVSHSQSATLQRCKQLHLPPTHLHGILVINGVQHVHNFLGGVVHIENGWVCVQAHGMELITILKSNNTHSHTYTHTHTQNETCIFGINTTDVRRSRSLS